VELNRKYQPIVIIAAGRSGTNALRDCLTRLPAFGTWDCDEINYIWRHGNVRYPTDEFTVEQATPSVRRYVQKAFDRLASRQNLGFVVEKTCANSLRVGFVDAIVPEAKYLFLVRDGRDVIASAMKRWRSYLKGVGHNMQKARYVPVTDLPYHMTRYAMNLLYRACSPDRRLAGWGPRFSGMAEMLRTRDLVEVCAVQWVRCVENSERDFGSIENRRVHRIKYEAFVDRPVEELKRICAFLEIEVAADRLQDACRPISSQSIGLWQKNLTEEQARLVFPLIQNVMHLCRYSLDGVVGSCE